MQATGIRLDSAAGVPLDNYQEQHAIPDHIRDAMEAEYLTLVKPSDVRTELTPRYNCHGLTFAARRTQITEAVTIFQILKEDLYDEVPAADLKAGDIVVFFGDKNEPMHSGIVLEPKTVIPGVCRIVSKWGIWREVVHYTSVGPYASLEMRFYRIQQC